LSEFEVIPENENDWLTLPILNENMDSKVSGTNCECGAGAFYKCLLCQKNVCIECRINHLCNSIKCRCGNRAGVKCVDCKKSVCYRCAINHYCKNKEIK
jgi:hypothetical protein